MALRRLEQAETSIPQDHDCIVEIEGAVTDVVLRAIQAQERARALAEQADRLRRQYQALSRRQEKLDEMTKIELRHA